MAHTNDQVLHEAIWADTENVVWIKRIVLVALGIAALALTAKVNIQVQGSPVPVTLTTFAVLSIGAAYGPRLGLATMFGYMLIGALGYDIFANSSAQSNGIEYMRGGTGGYLVGYLLATVALGYFSRLGWDRNPLKMGFGMLIGNALIYVPGLLWLLHLYGAKKPILDMGLTPYLVGDVLKLVLAAMIFPALWALIGKARS